MRTYILTKILYALALVIPVSLHAATIDVVTVPEGPFRIDIGGTLEFKAVVSLAPGEVLQQYSWEILDGGAYTPVYIGVGPYYDNFIINAPGDYRFVLTNTYNIQFVKTFKVTPTELNETDFNYVRVYAPQEQMQSVSQVISGSKSQVSVATKYYDGLGRLVQTIAKEASPDGKDLVEVHYYDEYNRETKAYLPYESEFASGLPKPFDPNDENDPLYLFYNDPSINTVARTAYPYKQTVFEKSPLQRTLEGGGAGAAHQPYSSGIPNSGHTIEFSERPNNANEVLFWELDSNNPKVNGSYAAGTLWMKQITDQDGNIIRTYTDRLGNKVLEEKVLSSTESLKTYYVYNSLDQLVAILSPKAVKLYEGSLSEGG